MVEQLSPEALARMRAEHVPEDSKWTRDDGLLRCLSPTCNVLVPDDDDNNDRPDAALWPCDAALLLAELDRRDNAVRSWTEARKAGIAMGLLGPVVGEELGR